MLATRITAISLVLVALAALVVAACGGGGEEEPQVGGLTDSDTVPTATPWAEPPGAIILDPTALTPVAGGNGGEDDGDTGSNGEVTPVEPFAVTSGDSTNLRDAPSTDGAITGTLDAGDEATVTGEVKGEAVTAGNDLWYQLEGGDFVYSGAVDRVD